MDMVIHGADICLVVAIFDVTVVLGAIVAPGTITDIKAGKSRSVDGVCWFTQMRDCGIPIVGWCHDLVSAQAISGREGE
ncbi:Ff.00g080450.m01.CDS01 [Fusarium sp. VM40]|nr:Ff.00g080450.m01.CDS01 [Fusarium sp. VM40]